jgi:hypothetical protein
MIVEVSMVALRTMMERAAPRRGATSQKALQHLALAGRPGGSESGQIGGSPSAQYFVDG